jgi:hypothetical protein
MEPPRTPKESAKQLPLMVWLGIVASILIIGFLAGMHYLKSSGDKTNTTAAGQSLDGSQTINTSDSGAAADDEPCPNGQHKAVLSVSGEQVVTCGTPANGEVTNVTSDSITITDSSDGSSKTYAITGDTVLAKKGGVRVKLSEITVGENIGVIPNDDNTAAKRILADLPS